MESVYQPLDGLIPGVSGAVLFWLSLAILLVVIGLVFKFKNSNSPAGSVKHINKSLKKLGSDLLSSVSVSDEVEGEFHFDHLCLTTSGIVVVDVKDFRGLLFGGANTDQWTQLIDSKSYKFDNPLYHNREKVQIIKSLVDEEIPVHGCVVFTEAGSFPKDQPDGVFTQNGLEDDFKYHEQSGQINPKYDNVWQNLKSQVGASPVA